MKENKKVILGVIKKHLERSDKFENQVLKLALKKMDGARDDGWGVYYSKGGKRLITAKKTLEGNYTVYPGHDFSTTLNRERLNNPYMRSL